MMIDALIGELTFDRNLRESAYWIPYSDEYTISPVNANGTWATYRYSLHIDTNKISYGKALALYGRLYTMWYEYLFKLIDSGSVLKPDSEHPAVLKNIIKRIREAYKQDEKGDVEIGRGRFNSTSIFHIYIKDGMEHVDIVHV